MLLDGELRAAWREHAKQTAGPVIGAVRLCDGARPTRERDRALSAGSAWGRVLPAGLVGWAAADSKEHAATAIKFSTALLHDRQSVGDHGGGDTSAHRDSGYATRNLGPYTALAY